MAAMVGAATLLADLAAASPALAVTGDGQLCSPSTNGGTMSNGVCVLPALNMSQNADEFLMNAGGGVATRPIFPGRLPPGPQMSAQYAAGSTIFFAPPSQGGRSPSPGNTVPYTQPGAPPGRGPYSFRVTPPLPLQV